MKVEWLNLQIHCIDNIKQKSYGSDFKISSQANHLTSLQALLTKDQEEALHLQRLYKRRKVSSAGQIVSNWSSLLGESALE